MPRMTKRLRAYHGALGLGTVGLIVCGSIRQAENLLEIGHKRFVADFKEVPVPDWATKFVVYVKHGQFGAWYARGDRGCGPPKKVIDSRDSMW